MTPPRYLLVLGALVSGYLVFGDLPDIWTSIGMVLVVGAGLYALRHEHQKSRAERAATGAAAVASGTGRAVPACAPPHD